MTIRRGKGRWRHVYIVSKRSTHFEGRESTQRSRFGENVNKRILPTITWSREQHSTQIAYRNPRRGLSLGATEGTIHMGHLRVFRPGTVTREARQSSASGNRNHSHLKEDCIYPGVNLRTRVWERVMSNRVRQCSRQTSSQMVADNSRSKSQPSCLFKYSSAEQRPHRSHPRNRRFAPAHKRQQPIQLAFPSHRNSTHSSLFLTLHLQHPDPALSSHALSSTFGLTCAHSSPTATCER